MKKISSYFCIPVIVFMALICTSCELEYTPMNSDPFRVALSLSPFALNQFEDGYSFVVGDKTATTPAELQAIYRDLGSTEMFVRIATKHTRKTASLWTTLSTARKTKTPTSIHSTRR